MFLNFFICVIIFFIGVRYILLFVFIFVCNEFCLNFLIMFVRLFKFLFGEFIYVKSLFVVRFNGDFVILDSEDSKISFVILFVKFVLYFWLIVFVVVM